MTDEERKHFVCEKCKRGMAVYDDGLRCVFAEKDGPRAEQPIVVEERLIEIWVKQYPFWDMRTKKEEPTMKNYWLNRKLAVYEVDDGEQHWYAAESREDALNQHLEPLRSPKTGEITEWSQEEIDEFDVRQLSSDTVLPVRQEDNSVVTKTAEEWCADGKGLIASTVY